MEAELERQRLNASQELLLETGTVGGQDFLSMEYLDGEDLNSLIRRIARLPQVSAAAPIQS